jgi:hypothetical protein
MRRNVENLSVGHAFESRMDLSAALELGADTATCFLNVLVEGRALQLRMH